jgi:S1-C subfamily serine protease
MNFKKILAVLFAVAALSSPAFSAVNSPALASLKGIATGDEFGLPETPAQPAVSGWQELVLKVAQNGVFTAGTVHTYCTNL